MPPRTTLPVLLAAQLVIPMSIAGTAVALPSIAGDLGNDTGPLHWVVNGFNVAFALSVLAWGAASDRIGHRATFRWGVAIVLLASAASAAAPDLAVLDASRAVAGAGAGAVITGATAMISHVFEGPTRARAFAVFGTVNGLGLALGPTVSGALVATAGWRVVFAVQAAVLLVATLGSLRLPFVAARPEGTAIDLRLLRHRRFLAMCLVPVAGAIGFVTVLTYEPAALAAVHGIGPGTAGLIMLTATVPVLLSPLAVGGLVARGTVSPRGAILASLAALVAGDLGLLLLAPGSSLLWILVPMALVGAGFGMAIGLVDGEALRAAPAHAAGTAAGLLNFFRIGSEAVAVAAYAAVLASLVESRLPAAEAAEVAAGGSGAPHVYASSLHVVLGGMALLVALVAAAVTVLDRPARAVPAGDDEARTAAVGSGAGS